MLERFLKPDVTALFTGQVPARLGELKDEFRRNGLVAVPMCLNDETLASLRRHFDQLGHEVDFRKLSKRALQDLIRRYGEHTRQHPFFDAIFRDQAFIKFLENISGYSEVRGRKVNVSIRFRRGEPMPPWHYDGKFVSLVIPIDAPVAGAGGEFAYFPRLRSSGETKARRFLGKLMTTLRLHRIFRRKLVIPYATGTFMIFDGDTTFHRAMRLRASSLRRSLLIFFTAGSDVDMNDDGY